MNTFLIQFLPDPQTAVKDMYRAIQPGGVLGFGIWHYHNDPNQAWPKACHILDPTYKAPKPHVAIAWYSTQELEKALRDVGLRDVRSETITVQHTHPSTESFLTFWFEGKIPAIQSMINDWTGSLEDVKRELAKIIREQYDDGKALFLSFAIAAGKKPL
ncbi:hypothetical protein MMC12_001798 [Toensbergia leucococca]|nr:hypothetical protein [Toensbergia leucococca]